MVRDGVDQRAGHPAHGDIARDERLGVDLPLDLARPEPLEGSRRDRSRREDRLSGIPPRAGGIAVKGEDFDPAWCRSSPEDCPREHDQADQRRDADTLEPFAANHSLTTFECCAVLPESLRVDLTYSREPNRR